MTWDLPRPFVLLAQLAFCVFVNDTLFYWAHRALHHRSVYKYIHKQHHECVLALPCPASLRHCAA